MSEGSPWSPSPVRPATRLPVALSLAGACGGRPAPSRVLLPPRLDLKQYGQVGLVLFTLEKA
jgi:hypothetical protein